MTKQQSSIHTNTRLAQVLMYLAALSALLAGVGAITNVTNAANTVIVVELWRMIGFYTFAALFAFLAHNPQASRTVWAIVIGNKLALSIAGLFLMGNSAVVGANDLVIFDGGLTVLLIAASVLAGVWRRK